VIYSSDAQPLPYVGALVTPCKAGDPGSGKRKREAPLKLLTTYQVCIIKTFWHLAAAPTLTERSSELCIHGTLIGIQTEMHARVWHLVSCQLVTNEARSESSCALQKSAQRF